MKCQRCGKYPLNLKEENKITLNGKPAIVCTGCCEDIILEEKMNLWKEQKGGI